MSGRASVVLACIVGCVVALQLACAPPPEDAVGEAARHFWSALRAGDTDRAAAVALPIAPERLSDLAEARPLEALALHETMVGDAQAAIETSLPTGDPAEPLRFMTHLVETEQGWRVDAERTASELRTASLARGVLAAEESIRETSRALGEAIARGARDASRALEEAVEAWEREFDATRPEPAPPGGPDEPSEEEPPSRPTERRL